MTPRSARARALRPRRIRWALLAAVGVALAVAGLAAVSLARAASDLQAARDRLSRVDALVEEGRIDEARAALDDAYGHAAAANSRLYGNPALDAVGALPVAAANLRSLRDSAGDSLALIDGGRRILDAARPLEDPNGRLEVSLRSGEVDAPAIAAVRAEVEATVEGLPRDSTPDDDDGRWLLGPVRELRDEVDTESAARLRQLASVADGLRIVEDLTGTHGPRRFLVAVANPAEMRGTGGMILSYGVLESAEGRVHVGPFGRIDEIALPSPLPPEQTDLPADLLARWSGFDLTQRWRNATAPADLTAVGPTLLAMYEHATGERADGVIQVDPVGLAAVLEATGPVQVAELGSVDADNVVRLTLNEAYVRYPDIDQRSDVLAEVAEAAFDRLLDGEIPSLRGLGEALLRTTSERHLAMWTRDVAAQAAITAFGASGDLPAADDEYVHLGVQNISGNKLDYYVDTTLALEGQRPVGAPGRVRATVTVANTAPAGVSQPRYVFGPLDDSEQAGVYRGLVSLYLPRGTTLLGAGGDAATAPAVVAEDGRAVVQLTVAVPASSARTVTVDLLLPPRRADAYHLVAVPSPRLRPTVLRVDVDTGDGRLRFEAPLVRPVALAPDRTPTPTTPG